MNVLVGEAGVWRAAEGSLVRSGSSVLVAIGACVILVAAPLGFGATSTLASLLLIAASWLLLLFWLAERIYAGNVPLFTHPLSAPAVLLIGFTTLHWLAKISVAPVATELEWLRWVGYAALAIVGVSCFDTPERLRSLAAGLAVAGCAIALLGIAQYLTASGKLYWIWELENGGRMFGPYVNRNHFAGLMELWCPLALGMAVLPQNSLPQRWFWAALAMVMSGAVVLSSSRGGTLSLAVVVVAFTLLVAAQRGGKRAVIALLVVMTLVGGIILALDQGEALDRYKSILRPHQVSQEEAASYRLAAWRDTFALFRQNWMIGSGLDSFATLFPAVRSFATDKIWTHAHNDFLQFLAETGLVGGALGLWVLVAGSAESTRNLRRTAGTATGAILAGIASGCLGFMAHSWLDFNFHIPANAASFAVLAAVLTRRGWNEA
jgi:O-antigen ligase